MDIKILGRTGPRSLKGKAISSMNAVKHGAYAKTKVLLHEDASERQRLTRSMYKDLKPKGVAEESIVDQMIDSLWMAERLKLRMAMKQDNIFAQLTPATLAELINVPEVYRPFAPDYLKETNTRFSKKELKLPIEEYKQYLHLYQNSRGIANYQTVFNTYKVLFKGVDEFIGDDFGTRFILSTGAGLEIAWQQNPRKVEEVLLEYAASLYYMIHMDELRPSIRHAMASWFFLDRMHKKESDYQDDMVIKELNRFKSLLELLMKLRKSRFDHSTLTAVGTPEDNSIQRNEIAESEV